MVKPRRRPAVYWHVTNTGQVRRCFVLDKTKREGQGAALDGDPSTSYALRYGGYSCLLTRKKAEQVSKWYRGPGLI